MICSGLVERSNLVAFLTKYPVLPATARIAYGNFYLCQLEHLGGLIAGSAFYAYLGFEQHTRKT